MEGTVRFLGATYFASGAAERVRGVWTARAAKRVGRSESNEGRTEGFKMVRVMGWKCADTSENCGWRMCIEMPVGNAGNHVG